MRSNVTVVGPEEFDAAVAAWLARRLQEDVGEARISLAIPGGVTPRPIYERLARTDAVPWSRVVLVQTDERAVPPASPRSNARMIRSSLLAPLTADPPEFLRMEAERSDLTHAAEDYAHGLPRALRIVLLGVGTDGHVASIFPGDAATPDSDGKAVPKTSPDGEPRMTLTSAYLRTATHTLVCARGIEKAHAVQQALAPEADPLLVPAARFRDAEWILDAAAASRLVD